MLEGAASRRMYDAIRYATAVYRNELAKRIYEIGYLIQPAKHGFEIEGVSPTMLKLFSKRAQQRDAVVQEMEQKLGRKLSNNEISHAVHQSRAKKLKGISTSEVRERQLAQLSRRSNRSAEFPRTRELDKSYQISNDEPKMLAHAVAHVFERKSVVPEHELMASRAWRVVLGEVDLPTLKAAVK
jgi:hypothetical protein